MKNNKMKQRHLDRESDSFITTISTFVCLLAATMWPVSLIFNYFDPSGTAFWVFMDLVMVWGGIWMTWKAAKFKAKAIKEGSE